MHNHWGGSSFEISSGDHHSLTEDDKSRNMEWDRASASHHQQNYHHYQHLDETQQSWLLGPPEKKKKKYVDLGCVVCSTKALKWTAYGTLIAFFVIGLPVMIAKLVPKHEEEPPVPDDYAVALNKSLLFFNAQKSGRLPGNNKISWRGNSGLQDGSDLSDVKGGLVGGYYDAGDNIKFHFPMSFAMTMLSWSVIEYEHKYRAIGKYDHVRELIKWGTDYLLLTFNSSATDIHNVYSQVGTAKNFSSSPDDHYCWTRPEDMDYPREVLRADTAADLGSEMAAALAAASIVFRDDSHYSQRLVKGATTVFKFARDRNNRGRYCEGNAAIEPFYSSTGYWDEFLWGSAWMYYATGNVIHLQNATKPGGFTRNGNADKMTPDLSVLSWDNKFPAAMLLLTRMRMVLNPGYPYEEMLKSYHELTGLTMCSYLQRYNVFNWTRGGLILLDHGRGQNLQYVANAAFMASLFVDYMDATGVPGWYCGPDFIPKQVLRDFATSQMNYILGANPLNMSYVVGFGSKYPKHVHHRGASIPHNKVKYLCSDGWKWRDSKNPNPNIIIGAMVGGPDKFDKFKDVRANHTYTEPTLAGNAGLVAALVSLTSRGGLGVDKNTIFSAIPPLYTANPPPPPLWKP